MDAKQELMNRVNTVLNDKDIFTAKYLGGFGIPQNRVSEYRNGSKDIKNATYGTILRFMSAYDGKIKSDGIDFYDHEGIEDTEEQLDVIMGNLESAKSDIENSMYLEASDKIVAIAKKFSIDIFSDYYQYYQCYESSDEVLSYIHDEFGVEEALDDGIIKDDSVTDEILEWFEHGEKDIKKLNQDGDNSLVWMCEDGFYRIVSGEELLDVAKDVSHRSLITIANCLSYYPDLSDKAYRVAMSKVIEVLKEV